MILPEPLVTLEELTGEALATFQTQQSLPDTAQVFKVTYYGINHYGVLESGGNDKLLIYCHGHASSAAKGNPYNDSIHAIIVSEFKAAGYDVLSLSMTGHGFNNDIVHFPATYDDGATTFEMYWDEAHALLHDLYQFYYDENYSYMPPMALIMSGNYYLISNFVNKYDEIKMMGISGGGWYATMLPAIIPKISESYSFAGSMPMSFREKEVNQGDYEQKDARIWQQYDYWDFYIMALFDESGELGRKQHLIFNDNDACCFMDPEASEVKSIVDDLNISGFGSTVVQNDQHSIDLDFVRNNIL